MNLNWKRLSAWLMALTALVVLLVSTALILLNPAGQDARAWEYLSGAVFGCGAPILGLVILRKQPHNRIGWLWLVIGWVIAFISLPQGLKYSANTTLSTGYSDLVFTILLFNDTGYILRFICMILMMLWFPDGNPPSPRWKILHGWLAVSFILLSVELFLQRVPWSSEGGVVFGTPLVDNPIGFLPVSFLPAFEVMAPIGFFSIIGMTLLTVLALLLRYRSSGQLVRAQIRWFVVGGVIYVACFVASIILSDYSTLLPGILTNLALLPLYLAIGVAITRYRLYDIDVIIRKTLLYALLTGLLGLVYFGGGALLQTLLDALGGGSSPLIIVLTTLLIAALFNPLQRRVQDFIDRGFYRQKYDAEKALAAFAAEARSETDLEKLAGHLTGTVKETLQPEQVSLWMQPAVHQKQTIMDGK